MYYIVFSVLVLFSWLNLFQKVEKLKIWYFFTFLLLLFFAGLRYKVGFDYDNYNTMTKYVAMNLQIFVEPLFWLIIKVTQFVSEEYTFFIFLIALFSVSLKFKFLYNYSFFPLVSILLYFSRIYLNADFGQLRQGLALGIILFTYPTLINKNLMHFSLLVVGAALIHASAILFFPVYFIANRSFSRKFIIILISIAMFIATIDLKAVLVQTFQAILPSGLAGKLLFYSTTEEELGITLSVILRLLMILFSITYFWKEIKGNQNIKIIFNIYFYGYIFYLLFNSLPQLGGRGSIYFQQFELLLFPFLLYFIKDRTIKLLFYAFLIFYCYWGIRTTLNSVSSKSSYHFEPYESIL